MSRPEQAPQADAQCSSTSEPTLTPDKWMDDLESALCRVPTLGALIEAGRDAAVKAADHDKGALHVDLLLEHAAEYCRDLEFRLSALVATVERVMHTGRTAP